MKNKCILGSLLLILIASSCVDRTTTAAQEQNVAVESTNVNLVRYPVELQKIFEAHGGLERWNQMQSLTFTMPKSSGDETHTVELKSRKTLIETSGYQLGFDGDSLWLAQAEQKFDPNRAEFYYNLMFYFYAIPFVLADDGIKYEQAPALEKDGQIYPAIKISYEDNVGNSPEDNYIVYYNQDTKKMAWLAYTVTYGQESPTQEYSFIHYSDWQDVKGLQLPETLTWYKVENGLPTVLAGEPRVFEAVDIDASAMDDAFYNKPKNGKYIN